MLKSKIISPRLTAALAYAKAGIPVFPCKVGGKKPANSNSFEGATTDERIIRGWWAVADYNLALCPEDAGWCVIDLDGPEGLEWKSTVALPPTRTVITPGGGAHLYYEGSLPSTIGKLAKHVDTRGRGGYVLAPPSIVNGKEYRLVSNELAPVPEWVAPLVQSRITPMKAPEGMVLDTEWMVDLARDYLKRIYDREGPWGQEDDPDTYKIAAGVKDHGISEELTVDLMMEHLAEDERDWIELTVDHVYRFGKHEIGAHALPDPASWGVEDLPPPPADEPEVPPRLLRNRFSFKTPEEDENEPKLEMWDEDGMLPKIHGGCMGVAWGKRSSHKTGVVIKVLADAAFNKGARVLYIPTEGANGIKTARLPKLCAQRGKTTRDLGPYWRTMPVTPNLLHPDDVDDLIAYCRAQEFAPDIIAIDVGTRAVPGADINSPMVGIAIALALDRLAQEFNATVIYVTHPGKDTSRGAIGSTLLEDLSFFVWQISHEEGVVRAWVDKMKDGPAEFTIPFRIQAISGVPVVVNVPAEERKILAHGGPTHDELRDMVYEIVYGRIVAGHTVSLNNSVYGSRVIAEGLGVEEARVKKALDQLVARNRIKPDPGHGYQLPDGARAPGSLND